MAEPLDQMVITLAIDTSAADAKLDAFITRLEEARDRAAELGIDLKAEVKGETDLGEDSRD